MAQTLVDRLLTIAVTATLTSAAWIVAGSVYLAEAGSGGNASAPAPVARGPQGGSNQTTAASATTDRARGRDARLIIPVLGIEPAQLHDTFTDLRGGGVRLHEALDIMAAEGTPVVAAGAGTVERLFQSAAGGNTVYLRSVDKQTIHYYAHLREYAVGLSEGQSVGRGARLGTVGASGNADPAAPHLHFAILRTTSEAEWWEPATAINPFPLLAGT